MSLTLDQALTALEPARAKALSYGMRASFVVLGQGGDVVAMHKMDGARLNGDGVRSKEGVHRAELCPAHP